MSVLNLTRSFSEVEGGNAVLFCKRIASTIAAAVGEVAVSAVHPKS